MKSRVRYNQCDARPGAVKVRRPCQHLFHSENSPQSAEPEAGRRHFSACSLPALVSMERKSL